MRRLLCLPYGLLLILLILLFALSACRTGATPEVIRDTSGQQTRTAAAVKTNTPSGPTATPTATSTPYARPTDDTALNLDQPIVRVGDETITLGQFRQRVRYERFAALDTARRIIERVGVANINFLKSGNNPTADAVAAIFSTLASYKAFGQQVYDNMIRESIIRQEYKARGLTLNPKDVRDYWVRQLDLQREPDIDKALAAAQPAYFQTAMNYSGLSREAINQIAEAFVMGTTLQPIIAKENAKPPSVMQFKLRHVLTKTQADADAAYAKLKQGADFRSVACQYSIDPTARGNGGDLGYRARGEFVPGVKNVDAVFQAKAGDIVGPLESPGGWYVFRVKDQRKNADGDTQVNVQGIVVASESLANEVKRRAQRGEDFAMLYCLYSLDQSGGNGGDLGYVDINALPPEVAQVLQPHAEYGLLEPIATKQGYQVILYEDRKVEIPQPADVAKSEALAFSNWQTSRANSNYVAPLSDVWKEAIPADPLPRDVSPLMREENFGLPTPAPTPPAAVTSAK